MSVAVKEKLDRATIARFKHLIERARFELKLANDMATAYGFGVKVQSPLNGARRELKCCLDEFEKVKGE